MPFLISLLSGLVSSTVIKALCMRAAVAFGFAAVTYTGVMVTMNVVVSSMNANLGQAGAGVLAMLNLTHLPQAFNVILSAYAGALALRGLTAAGAVTKVGISSAPGAAFSPGTF